MTEVHITDDVTIYNDMPRGWSSGKYSPLWHNKVYHMWRRMWRRVYTELNWFGCLIHPDFIFLSNYVEWIMNELRFEEFCNTCDNVRWNVDKDMKCSGNRNYYPEYMTLTTLSENAKEVRSRIGSPRPKTPVIAISDNKILIFDSVNDAQNKGFVPGHISGCINKKRKTHKGYKWYRITINII